MEQKKTSGKSFEKEKNLLSLIREKEHIVSVLLSINNSLLSIHEEESILNPIIEKIVELIERDTEKLDKNKKISNDIFKEETNLLSLIREKAHMLSIFQSSIDNEIDANSEYRNKVKNSFEKILESMKKDTKNLEKNKE